jgi:alkyldihydroxyacetonephosphate synthase
MYEGGKQKVDMQEKLINEIAVKHRGMAAGEENGKKGYLLTFLIAYIRDFAA